MDNEADDVLFNEFVRGHPQHARDDGLLDPEGYSAWTEWLGKVSATLKAALAEQPEPELPLARKLRTGTQEPSDWVEDEWRHWELAGRTAKEFVAAYGPNEDEPELLPVTQKLLGIKRER